MKKKLIKEFEKLNNSGIPKYVEFYIKELTKEEKKAILKSVSESNRLLREAYERISKSEY